MPHVPTTARRIWSMRVAGLCPPESDYYIKTTNQMDFNVVAALIQWHEAKQMMDKADQALERLAIADGFKYEQD